MHRRYERTHPWLNFKADLRGLPTPTWVTLGECQSKCEHIAGVPLPPDIRDALHAVYLAKGVWGTTAIEGNTLSEKEVLAIVQGRNELPPSKEYLKREVDNIIGECNKMLRRFVAGEPLELTPKRITTVNRTILDGLDLPDGVVPGKIRTYSVGVMGYRGAPAEDCEFLLSRLCDWLNGPDFVPKPGMAIVIAILKAVIAHLYVEWIHAFGDGNGRTGRLVEAQILMAAGVPSPAVQLMSNHYNATRREYLEKLDAASKSGGDIIPFIMYAVDGFLDGLRSQLEYIRNMQWELSWKNHVHREFGADDSPMAARQEQLAIDLFEIEKPIALSALDQISPRVAKAYGGKSEKTLMRDVKALEEKLLLVREGSNVRARRELILDFLPPKVQSRRLSP